MAAAVGKTLARRALAGRSAMRPVFAAIGAQNGRGRCRRSIQGRQPRTVATRRWRRSATLRRRLRARCRQPRTVATRRWRRRGGRGGALIAAALASRARSRRGAMRRSARRWRGTPPQPTCERRRRLRAPRMIARLRNLRAPIAAALGNRRRRGGRGAGQRGARQRSIQGRRRRNPALGNRRGGRGGRGAGNSTRQRGLLRRRRRRQPGAGAAALNTGARRALAAGRGNRALAGRGGP